MIREEMKAYVINISGMFFQGGQGIFSCVPGLELAGDMWRFGKGRHEYGGRLPGRLSVFAKTGWRNDSGSVELARYFTGESDVEEYAKYHFEKAVRKTLTIPAWLNVAAQEKHINFSQTLQEALLMKLKS